MTEFQCSPGTRGGSSTLSRAGDGILYNERMLLPKNSIIWLVYISFEEDKELREDKWNKKYEDKRVVF
eukprot:6283071-Ditylum_brightwellii.AAC.1